MTSPQSTPEVRPAFGGYLGGTEGIRGFFCILIVWYHCWLYTGGPDGPPTTGWLYTLVITRWQLGLMVFFMLSAFLLYRPFVQSIMRGTARPAFGAYLMNRVLRIFPAYWVILIATAIAGVTVVWVPAHDWDFHLPTFIANLFLVHGLHPSGMQTGVPPSWSLMVEWVFYLLLPLCVLLALRIGGRAATYARRRVAVLVPGAIMVAIGIAGVELARATRRADDPSGVLNTWHAVIDKSYLTWAALFGVGMFVAVLRVDWEDGRLRLPWWWRRAAIAAWIGISSVFIWAQYTLRLEWHYYNLLMSLPLGLFLCAVVMFKGETRRDPIMRVLEWRPFVTLGHWSLSIYLIHYPVIVFLIKHDIALQSGWAGMAFNWVFVSAIVFTLAYLCHRFVELPGMNRKFRRKVEGPPPVEAVRAGLDDSAAVDSVPVPARASS